MIILFIEYFNYVLSLQNKSYKQMITFQSILIP